MEYQNSSIILCQTHPCRTNSRKEGIRGSYLSSEY